MNQTLLTINEEIDRYIDHIEKKHQHDYSKIAELSILYISDRLAHAKEKFQEDKDLCEEEEIFYFKHIKAHLLGFIQYYTMLRQIEMKKPCCSRKGIKKYYLSRLDKVKRILNKNAFYYNYFKAGSSHLDTQLFLRINQDLFLQAGTFILDIDKRDNTPLVHVFAQIEAHEMIRNYLKKKIKGFSENHSGETRDTDAPLKWTLSKVDLIELIYALHSSGAFNNGRADLKEIAEHFQIIFDIDLEQYSRIFYDIRGRKSSKTKFLDSLKKHLLDKMKETDSQLFL